MNRKRERELKKEIYSCSPFTITSFKLRLLVTIKKHVGGVFNFCISSKSLSFGNKEF